MFKKVYQVYTDKLISITRYVYNCTMYKLYLSSFYMSQVYYTRCLCSVPGVLYIASVL